MNDNWLTRFLVRHKRLRVIYDRDGISEYLVRVYLLWKPKEKSTDYDNSDNHQHSFNVFLHKFMASDEPVLHNHPWDWGRIVLSGGYWEHTRDGKRTWCGPGHFIWRKADEYHWVELEPGINPWTLFFHGKRKNLWGFLVNDQWIYWKDRLNASARAT